MPVGKWNSRICLLLICSFWVVAGASILHAQMENVPIGNQVYEFLDRMGVKGALPLYSNTMIPLSREEVAGLLKHIDANKDRLTTAEQEYLTKFKQEFMREIDPSSENASVLFRDGFAGIFSDKEKYLYSYADSTVTTYLEFLGSLEHRRISGDSFGATHASLEQHGGRIRGTIKNRLGYFLQATNGTLYGDRAFALSDPRLRSNVKFNDLNSPYFDFTEAYLRADLNWFNFELGREYAQVGTGYADRLLLGDNAPAFDFIKLDARYKSVRFLFMHASILQDQSPGRGLIQQEPGNSNKYFTLHRVQVSLFDKLNVGASEMTVYQRYSPEFAYLNPIIFYKSVEHSLRDRDNSFLSFDLELFPIANYKVYGAWLIDDIDFSKIGTGWWGNEFGWQGGVYTTDVAGLSNLDALVEYVRLEPYVYSNRVSGNDYTHSGVSLGSRLQPNSDEWTVQLSYRPMKSLRTWLSYSGGRHGENVYDVSGQLIKNVGGDVLQGHRSVDSDVATFLDGNLVKSQTVQARAILEPITNFFVSGIYEYRKSDVGMGGTSASDNYGAVRVWIEY